MARSSQAGTVLDRVSDPLGEPLPMAELEKPSVGERIEELRLTRGWTRQELAEECARAGGANLDRTVIWKLENGKRHLKAEEAAILARALDVPLRDLLESGTSEFGERSDSADLPQSRRQSGSSSGTDQPPDLSQPPGEVRRAETGEFIGALDSARGPHFWLVIAPPGLGKTTLVSQLSAELTQRTTRWRANKIDIRAEASDIREDVPGLLSRLFGLSRSQVTDDQAGYLTVAKHISQQGRPLLCILDSAEELSSETSRRLRAALSAVYDLVGQTGNPRARLAFIVASRLDRGWRGVMPKPSLEVRPLAEFGTEVVEDRLRTFLKGTERTRPQAELERAAVLVHGVTAGLPALLDPVLEWIGNEEWLDLERLEEHDVFEALAADYIDSLLAPDSLLPGRAEVTEDQLELVREAIKYLVRYRFFTPSHTQRQLAKDKAFSGLLSASGWQEEDLWEALSDMTLLKRPLEQPWQEFQPAIRRLLWQHFYASDADRARAHAAAADFVADLSEQLKGKDQVTGLVAVLWHRASVLRLTGSDRVRERLKKEAADMVGRLRESNPYWVADLRAIAAEMMRSDPELLATIADIDGLADELVHIVTARE
jgi:transcriptional regulator with XRE-family HTH domain